MKRLLIFALAVSLCMSFVGCSGGASDGLEDFEQLLTGDQSEAETPFAERVYIIIPQDCGAELSSRALSIADKITERTGVPASIKYDNEAVVSAGNNLEILVGATNRLHSKEVIKPLKVGEYVCCWDRGVIIVGGRYEESTLEAMKEFEEKVLTGASSTSLMGENVRLSKTVDYDIASVSVNGYDLYDFTIIYQSENKNCEKEIAILLRDYLAKQSGYLLDVIPHTERSSTTGKVIGVGDVFEDKDAFADYGAIVKVVDGNNVLLSGQGGYGISSAAAEFISKISSSVKDKHCNAEISAPMTLKVDKASVKLCAAFVSNSQSVDQIADFTSNVHNGGNDIIIFPSVSAYISEHIRYSRYLYEYYNVSMANGSELCVLYNSSTIKDVAYDTAKKSVSFKSVLDERDYCISWLDDAQKASEYTTDAFDMLVVSASGEQKAIDGFSFVGGQANDKHLYIDNGLKLDGDLNIKNNTGLDWTNVFCTVNVAPLFCDEYIALSNTIKR